jgi:hypothetical protein
VVARQRHWQWLKDRRFTASLLRPKSTVLTGALQSCCWVTPTTALHIAVVSNLEGVCKGGCDVMPRNMQSTASLGTA